MVGRGQKGRDTISGLGIASQMDKLVACSLFKKKTNFEIKGVEWEQAIREPW